MSRNWLMIGTVMREMLQLVSIVVKIHCHNRATWQPGTIVETFSPDLYISSIDDGSHQKRYINQTPKCEVLLETN